MSDILPGVPKLNGAMLRSRVSHEELYLTSLSASVAEACDRFWERRGRNKYGGVGEAKPRWNGPKHESPEKGVAQANRK